MHLAIDPRVHAIFFGETFDQILLVQSDASWEVAGHADVQRTIARAGQDIDARKSLAIAHIWPRPYFGPAFLPVPKNSIGYVSGSRPIPSHGHAPKLGAGMTNKYRIGNCKKHKMSLSGHFETKFFARSRSFVGRLLPHKLPECH